MEWTYSTQDRFSREEAAAALAQGEVVAVDELDERCLLQLGAAKKLAQKAIEDGAVEGEVFYVTASGHSEGELDTESFTLNVRGGPKVPPEPEHQGL
jgi:hypothetical protein